MNCAGTALFGASFTNGFIDWAEFSSSPQRISPAAKARTVPSLFAVLARSPVDRRSRASGLRRPFLSRR